jgi:hypothetical protein
MEIKHVNIDALIPYVRNTRTHNDAQVAQIAASIKEFGWTNPILVDGSNGIIAGHGRVMAAKKLGLAEVPVIELHNMTEAQRRAYVIADNQLALNAGWDNELLALEIKDLQAMDYNIDLLGFAGSDIDALLADMQGESGGLTDPDDVPDVLGNYITQPGDVWILGGHRLMCGSSTDRDSVLALLDGQSPNTMITDPPYGVKYEANWRSKAKGRVSTDRENSSNLKNDDQADWFEAYMLFPGAVAYVWHASAFTDVVMDGLRRAGFDVKQQIIWNKNVHALSRSDYHWKHEPCWYATRGGGDRNWKGGARK